MKNRLTLSAFVLAAALLALGSLAAASPPTTSKAGSESAQGPRAPRVACSLPLVMGNLWAGNPTYEINAVDAGWVLSKAARLPLPDGGTGCSTADIDCDRDVDTVDALWILRYVAGLPYTQQEPCPDIGTEVPHM